MLLFTDVNRILIQVLQDKEKQLFLKKYNINYEIKSKLYFYSIEKLKNDLKEIGTFEGIGKKYNVNGNSIRKWCVKNGLPFHIKEIKNIINNGSV